MNKYGPIVALILLFCAAFVFSPEEVPIGDVAAPLRTAPSDTRATRIFRGGPIITMDDEGHVAAALATRDSEIVAVGDERSILRMLGPDTRVVDLRGNALLPGFIDVEGRFADTTSKAAMHGFTTLSDEISEATLDATAPSVVPRDIVDAETFAQLDALTRSAARRTRDAERKGSLEPGKVADLVVVDASSLIGGDAADFEIVETIQAGDTIYRR